MLTLDKKWIKNNINKEIEVNIFGQELNPQTYSICKSDFLITDEGPENINLGITLSKDGFQGKERKFDYMICNAPYGVSWKKMKNLSRMNQKMKIEVSGRCMSLFIHLNPSYNLIAQGRPPIRIWVPPS